MFMIKYQEDHYINADTIESIGLHDGTVNFKTANRTYFVSADCEQSFMEKIKEYQCNVV